MRDQLVCTGCWKWFDGTTECPTCKIPLVDPETGHPVPPSSVAAASPATPHPALATSAGGLGGGAQATVTGYPGGGQAAGTPRLQVTAYLARRTDPAPASTPPTLGAAPRIPVTPAPLSMAPPATPDGAPAPQPPPLPPAAVVPAPPAPPAAPDLLPPRVPPFAVTALAGQGAPAFTPLAAAPAPAAAAVPPASGAAAQPPPRPGPVFPHPAATPVPYRQPLAPVPGDPSRPASASLAPPPLFTFEPPASARPDSTVRPAVEPTPGRAEPPSWPLPPRSASPVVPLRQPGAPDPVAVPPEPAQDAGSTGWGVRETSAAPAPMLVRGLALHAQLAPPAVPQPPSPAEAGGLHPGAGLDSAALGGGRTAAGRSGRRAVTGAVAALVAGLVVAALWVAAVIGTDLELAPLALLVGAASGLAMRRWGRAGSPRAAIIATLAAVIAVGLGLVFSGLAVYSHGRSASFVAALGQLHSFLPHLEAQTGTIGAALGVAGALLAGLAVLTPGRSARG